MTAKTAILALSVCLLATNNSALASPASISAFSRTNPDGLFLLS